MWHRLVSLTLEEWPWWPLSPTVAILALKYIEAAISHCWVVSIQNHFQEHFHWWRSLRLLFCDRLPVVSGKPKHWSPSVHAKIGSPKSWELVIAIVMMFERHYASQCHSVICFGWSDTSGQTRATGECLRTRLWLQVSPTHHAVQLWGAARLNFKLVDPDCQW